MDSEIAPVRLAEDAGGDGGGLGAEDARAEADETGAGGAGGVELRGGEAALGADDEDQRRAEGCVARSIPR